MKRGPSGLLSERDMEDDRGGVTSDKEKKKIDLNSTLQNFGYSTGFDVHSVSKQIAITMVLNTHVL